MLVALAFVQAILLFLVVSRDGSLRLSARLSASLTFLLSYWILAGLLLGLAMRFRYPELLAAHIAFAILLAPFARLPKGDLTRLRHWCLGLDFASTLALLLIVGAMGFQLWHGYPLPPIDFDGLNYHLPIGLNLVQDQGFIHYEGGNIYLNYFARGSEILVGYVILITGSIIAVNLVQWIMLPLLLLTMYDGARGAGLATRTATLVAALGLMVPVTMLQAVMTYADLLSVGLLMVALIALAGGFAPAENTSAGLTLLRGLWIAAAAGSALAVKFNVAGPLVLVALGTLALIGRKGAARGAILLPLLLALALSAPWLIRNAVLFGSPIYPSDVSVGGFVLFEGAMSLGNAYGMPSKGEGAKLAGIELLLASWQRIALPDSDVSYTGDEKMGGLGLLWYTMLLPSLLAAMLVHRPSRLPLLMLAAAAAFLLLTPGAHQARRTLFLPLFGAISFGLILDAFSRMKFHCLRGVLAVLAIAAGTIDLLSATVLHPQAIRVAAARREKPEALATPGAFLLWGDTDPPGHLVAAKIAAHLVLPGDKILGFCGGSTTLLPGMAADQRGASKFIPVPDDPHFHPFYSPQGYVRWIRGHSPRFLIVSDTLPPATRETLKEDLRPKLLLWHRNWELWELDLPPIAETPSLPD
jgi:hypothetical protein